MRFFFERLERRDLLTVLRLASWNTANNPDVPAEDAEVATILQAIGAESVQGISTRVDLLALQETDLPGAGLDSIGRIEDVLEALYPGVDYGTAVTSLDGGGDATGFVYDTTTLALLSTHELDGGLTHTTLRGEFRPVGTAGASDFFVYSTHLKAGNTTPDQNLRATEAALLRADADSLGVGAHVIMAGDFNIQSSSELAYVNFLSSGTAQLQDPLNAPGNWHDNNSFRNLHTQNPADPAGGGGGMDDRFDFQLTSGEFYDGVGIDYVAGSYHAFGNNGTHALNGAITSGTGAAANVLNALASVSDHLPVVADYEILGTTPGVSVVELGGDTVVGEGGHVDAYTVTLTSIPSDDVTVTVTPDLQTDLGAGPGSSVVLVFTPDDALTGQTVVVTANDDVAAEGTHTSVIVQSAQSNDAAFNGLPINDVVATVLDDEAPTIVINESDADTDGIDMLEFVELYDGGLGNASLSGLTVVFFNGSNDQSYAAFDLDGFSTDQDGLFLLGNDALGPDLTFNNNLLQNGADAVAIYSADAADFPNGTSVTTADLMDALVYDTNDGDDAGLLPLLAPMQPQINEDENGNRLFDALARVPDGGALRETMSFRAQLPTPGAVNAPRPKGVVITQSGGRTDVEEGGVDDSYTVALTTFPAADVTVTISPDAQVDLGNGPGAAIQLTFSPSDAIIPQTVAVVAVDDNDIEGDHAAMVAHATTSADPDYDGVSVGTVTVNITDNEAAPEINVVISEIMYNPDSDESGPVAEWIEVVNKGNTAASLDGWAFDDEDSTDWGSIPTGTELAIDQVAVFFDAAFTTESVFRSSWMVPSGSLVVGIDWGSLANSPSATNEVLQLVDNSGTVRNEVNYDDSGDWPSDNPDGPSIYLLDLASDSNNGLNWMRSTSGTDHARNPVAPFSPEDVGSPGQVPSSTIGDGDFNDDGLYDCLDIDALVGVIAGATHDISFDLTGDLAVDENDLSAWLLEAGEFNLGAGRAYLPGDANLDGTVDVQDFMAWNANKFTSGNGWCGGDFNADGTTNGRDFLIWNANKFQSSDVRPSALVFRADDWFREEKETRSARARSPQNCSELVSATLGCP